MIKPVAWIGQDAFAALLGGETICQTMTPSQAMYDDVPLTVIPPGFAIVPVELLQHIEFNAKGYCPACDGWNVSPNGATRHVHTKDCELHKALITAAKGE